MQRKDLPQSVMHEQCLLGTLMLDESPDSFKQDAVKSLCGSDFFKDSHCTIYQEIVGMYCVGKPINIVTVSAALEERGQLQFVGGRSYVAGLIDHAMPYEESVKDCIDTISAMAKYRALIEKLLRLLNLGMDGDCSMEDLLAACKLEKWDV